MINTTVADVVEIKNKVIPSRGDFLYVFEPANEFFNVKRVFTIRGENIEDANRGHHAHKRDQQIITCPSGSISLVLKDGQDEKTFFIDSPEIYIYVPTYIWGETTYLEKGTVVSVFSSETYDESSYIRDYQEFLEIRGSENGESL